MLKSHDQPEHLCSTFGNGHPTKRWVKMPNRHFNSLGWPVFIHQIVYCIFVEKLMKGYKTDTYLLKYILFAESVKSGYKKTAQFSLKPASIVDATTVLRIFNNVRNLKRSKRASHSDTETRLFYLITILFPTNLLFYIALHVGHLSPCIYQR